MPWDDGKHALGWWNTKEDHFAFDFWWIVTGPCWFHQWWSLDSITGSDVRFVWLCWTFLDIFGSKHDQQVISVNPIYIVHRLIPHQSSRFALGALDQPRETELKRRHKVPWSRVVWLSLLCSTRFQFLVTCNLMIWRTWRSEDEIVLSCVVKAKYLQLVEHTEITKVDIFVTVCHRCWYTAWRWG